MKKTFTTLFMLALAATASQAAPVGDAQAGAGKIAMCVGCHGIVGYQASFPQVHKVPMISGQSAAYMTAALLAYQKGDRKHPTMRGVADPLTEQDIADIAAHYAAQAKPVAERPAREPSAQVAALLQKGACESCHGPAFGKPIDASYPKVAGQYADYLYVALMAYKADKRMTVVGRSNPIMAGVVQQFTPAELRALANYAASQEGALHTVPQSRFR